MEITAAGVVSIQQGLGVGNGKGNAAATRRRTAAVGRARRAPAAKFHLNRDWGARRVAMLRGFWNTETRNYS